LDLKELKEILQILEEKEIAEFELEEEGMKLRIRKAAAVSSNHAADATLAGPLAAPLAPQAPAPAPALPSSAPAPAEANDLVLVRSPMVGTFFRAPDPNSAPFVNTGDRVKVGQVLCIIEAMKLMNEIEAEVAGQIAKVHHENGQPVQYGEALFSIRPDR
jgi:acetyl-CoA carboxylase biotin carboxyl carrier protein